MTEDYSKDFGYLLQENNVIGGVVNGAAQIYGDMMIMNERGLNTINRIDGVRETLNEKFPFKTIISLNGIRLHNTGEEKK